MDPCGKGFVAIQSVSRIILIGYLHSKQYTQLSACDVKLIIDLGSMYNGINNGDLSVAWKLMSKRGWKSKGALAKSIKSVVNSGL